MGPCRLSLVQRARLTEHLETGCLTGVQFKELRALKLLPVGVPQQTRRNALEAIIVRRPLSANVGAQLPWVPFLGYNREAVADTVFKMSSPGGEIALELLFFMANPMLAGFAKLDIV